MAFGCFWRRCCWGFFCFPILYILLGSALWGVATANVLLIGKNVSLSFNDIEANFGKKKMLPFGEFILFLLPLGMDLLKVVVASK